MIAAARDGSLTLRQCHDNLALSQIAFAIQLGLPLNTYRTWDSGRRPVRDAVLARARALADARDRRVPLSLAILALILGVHVRTLQTAARDGRLRVRYNTVAFGKPVPRASLDAGERFMQTYYRQSYRRDRRSVRRPVRPVVPPDYADRVQLPLHRIDRGRPDAGNARRLWRPFRVWTRPGRLQSADPRR